MVTVIIPTYNRSKMAAEAIQSVLSQTYKEYEIIVVDDASSDDTPEVIERGFYEVINQGVLRYFRNERHSERSFARNRGIKESKGDYIAFLDDDDLFLPMHLEICLAAMGDAQVVGAGIIITDSHRHIIGKNLYLFSDKLSPNELSLLGLGIGGSNAMVRKDVIAKAGLFREDMDCAEDIDFFMRVAMKSSILYLKNETILRQKHPGHYIYDINKAFNYRYLRGLKSMLFENADRFSYALTPRLKGYLHLYLAWNSISNFMRRYAIKCLIEAIGVYPRLLITEPFILLIFCRLIFMWNRKVHVFLKRIKQLCLPRV